MFSFFKKKSPPPAPAAPAAAPPDAFPGTPAATPAAVPSAVSPAAQPRAPALPAGPSMIGSALVTPIAIPEPAAAAASPPERQRWLSKLQAGLRKTGSSISTVFTGGQIDEQLYEDLETALLMADTGVKATEHLLADVKRRVKDGGMTHPVAVKNALVESLALLLKPLEKALVIGEFKPTVIMVAGVNGAGKTTSIGKLTAHLASEGATVLLAAADTFRAAAKEQLAVWADRNTVEIVSQEGGDPAAVSFDAVSAGKARGRDVVLVDTAGRLPTQLHLMEELRKMKRVIGKIEIERTVEPSSSPAGAVEPALPGHRRSAPSGGSAVREATSVGAAPPPHEVLLVIDGNTGQNALSQVKAFDDALQLTGLIVTKLDGTAKGGVLAAIALWARERQAVKPDLKPVPVYFIGVGEKLEDLETFNAREFAQALLA
ncbi:signaling recognition particle receptor family protein [Polaromonas sp.]|uniref:signal recognition particle-docking protein FtsY n=1 Tax=Polaromonas sp. TaxID=1869339 RepID=UPI002BBF2E14|nr:signaling recognition particle receptor family protein [Polaromonas sp.]HQS33267.1 signaling recognition particle receptor family protein [Polaromonas sp.]HQS90871.1 signaling recognition particle receptor family protein [Polaromonas sp.]